MLIILYNIIYQKVAKKYIIISQVIFSNPKTLDHFPTLCDQVRFYIKEASWTGMHALIN